MDQHSVGHIDCDPDRCFAAKMAFWRKHGAPGVHIPEGWKGPSVQARARQEVADAAANGRIIESANPSYYGPV